MPDLLLRLRRAITRQNPSRTCPQGSIPPNRIGLVAILVSLALPAVIHAQALEWRSNGLRRDTLRILVPVGVPERTFTVTIETPTGPRGTLTRLQADNAYPGLGLPDSVSSLPMAIPPGLVGLRVRTDITNTGSTVKGARLATVTLAPTVSRPSDYPQGASPLLVVILERTDEGLVRLVGDSARGPRLALSTGSISTLWRMTTQPPSLPSIDISNAASQGPGGVSDLRITSITTAGGPTGWLTASLSRATLPATLQMTVDTTGLRPVSDGAPRQYSALVTLSSPATGAQVQVPVTILVFGPPGTIAVSRDSVQLSIGTTDPGTVRDSVMVTNSTGSLLGLQALRDSVVYDGASRGWLRVSVSSEISPSILRLEASNQGLPTGRYTATVFVTDTTSVNQSVPVRVVLIAGVSRRLVPSHTSIRWVRPTNGNRQWRDSIAITSSLSGSLGALRLQLTTLQGNTTAWLQASLRSTTTETWLNIAGTIDSTDRAPRQAQIRVSSPDAPDGDAVIVVSLTPPAMPGLRGAPDSLLMVWDPYAIFPARRSFSLQGLVSPLVGEFIDSVARPLSVVVSPVAADSTARVELLFQVVATAPTTAGTLRTSLQLRSGQDTVNVPISILMTTQDVSTFRLLQWLRSTPPPLSNTANQETATWIDAAGNQNGQVDVGDIAAIVARRRAQ